MSLILLFTGAAASHAVTPVSQTVNAPTMRVVSGNASTISLIAQAASEASGGASTLGGRQIVTVPAGQGGLAGAKGPVQITITPANRAGISTITLPSNIRQVAKPVVVNSPAANGTQVVRLSGATVVSVNPPASAARDSAAAMISSEAQAAADALVNEGILVQHASAGDDASLQQFDGASDNVSEDGIVEDFSVYRHVLSSSFLFVESDDIKAGDSLCHLGDQLELAGRHMDQDDEDSFVLPQFDGAYDDDEDEEGGGDEEMETDAHDGPPDDHHEIAVEHDLPAQVGQQPANDSHDMVDDGHLEAALLGQVNSFIIC